MNEQREEKNQDSNPINDSMEDCKQLLCWLLQQSWKNRAQIIRLLCVALVVFAFINAISGVDAAQVGNQHKNRLISHFEEPNCHNGFCSSSEASIYEYNERTRNSVDRNFIPNAHFNGLPPMQHPGPSPFPNPNAFLGTGHNDPIKSQFERTQNVIDQIHNFHTNGLRPVHQGQPHFPNPNAMHGREPARPGFGLNQNQPNFDVFNPNNNQNGNRRRF